jgi:threonine aldolase
MISKDRNTRGPIDLRSDTVTRPTAAMRRAMAEAEVGDDVFREDPTVRRLEELAAERLGKEAALFVPTGTMGNQIAVKVWTRPGQEVVLEERSHIYNYEMATMAAFSGVLARPVRSEDGIPDPESVRKAIRPPVYYLSPAGLVTVENTHNMAGGTVAPQARCEAIARVARDLGLPIHLDGARIFNAAVAVGRPATELVRPFDSVMFCLSKGLGAPVGSLVAGSRVFIDEALRVRKRLGGGMRQAGVLAAAGLLALTEQVDRLAEDHANARRLAERLGELGALQVDPDRVQTNIVIFAVQHRALGAPRLVERWRARGVLALALDETQVRVVTHYDVDRQDIEAACERLAEIIGEAERSA